jgi:hypothetical protein
MQSYQDLTAYFGAPLADASFQTFLATNFKDMTPYAVGESNYISSEQAQIELGFQNDDAVFDEDNERVFDEGNPLFSTINIFPGPALPELPFGITFTDSREEVLAKAGAPTQTRHGGASVLGPAYLVDNFKVNETVISVDYNPERQTINFIQIRDNNLVAHLRL